MLWLARQYHLSTKKHSIKMKTISMALCPACKLEPSLPAGNGCVSAEHPHDQLLPRASSCSS